MAGQVEALLHELERHILGGRVERAAAIRRELAALGHDVEAPTAPVVESTTAAVPPETADTSAPSVATVAPAAPETAAAPSVGA